MITAAIRKEWKEINSFHLHVINIVVVELGSFKTKGIHRQTSYKLLSIANATERVETEFVWDS